MLSRKQLFCFKCKFNGLNITVDCWYFSIYSDSYIRTRQMVNNCSRQHSVVLLQIFQSWGVIITWFNNCSALPQKFCVLWFSTCNTVIAASTVQPTQSWHFAVFCCGKSPFNFSIRFRACKPVPAQPSDCPSTIKAARYLGLYFSPCINSRDINNNITFSWAHKRFCTQAHTVYSMRHQHKMQ